MKKIALFLLLAAVAGCAFWWKTQQQGNDLPAGIAMVNGRLELNRVDVASLYAGRVEEVFVQEGDRVNAGDPLLRLSSELISNQVAASLAQIESAQAQVEAAKAQKARAADAVQRANAEIAAQQQQLAVAKLELDNAKKLKRDNLISATELERRAANHKAVLAAIDAAKAAKAEAQATVNQAQAGISQAQAVVEAARAQSDAVKSQSSDMLVKAPISGRVEYRLVDAGNVISVGGRVISLLDTADVSMNVFLPSYQANRVQLGDEARIQIDGVAGLFPAKVKFVASEAQFTPKSVETAEERAKLMFKIKLQIPQNLAAAHPDFFKGGMTAVGYVRYDVAADWGALQAVQER